MGALASALIHLGFLAALLLSLSKLPPEPLPPAMEVTLIRPSAFPAPARPRPQPETPAPAPRLPRPPATTEPSPRAPLQADRSQTQNRPAAPGPARAPADVLQFFKKHVPGCGREDFILLPPEEQERCRVRLAMAAAAERGNFDAADRRLPGLSGIPSEKLTAYEQQAERQRRRREDPAIQPFEACQGTGSNLGLGCINPGARPN